jgi:hypothetical protein
MKTNLISQSILYNNDTKITYSTVMGAICKIDRLLAEFSDLLSQFTNTLFPLHSKYFYPKLHKPVNNPLLCFFLKETKL